MAKFLVDNSIEKTCKTHLSERFLEWCKFDEQLEYVKSNPVAFLHGHVFYILNPPKRLCRSNGTFFKRRKKDVSNSPRIRYRQRARSYF